MLTYIARRVLYSIPVLVIASFLVFTFVALVSDPLAAASMQPNTNEAIFERIRREKHLDEPIVVRYGYWVKDAVTNKFGTKVLGDTPIWPDLKRVLGNTLQLVIFAEIFAIILGVLIGVYSAIRQYSLFDYAATAPSFLGLSIPVFWLGLLLQLLFTHIYLKYDLRIFYTAQYNSVDPGTGIHFWLDRLQHMALPLFTLAVLNIAAYSRYMRASMLEVVNSDYVRTARAKGLHEMRVVGRHAFRNALIPLTTLVGLGFGTLFGGAIITETIFSLDGMGLYFIENLNQGDPYPVMAWMMVTSTMVIVGNLITDVVYGFLDPRIRYD